MVNIYQKYQVSPQEIIKNINGDIVNSPQIILSVSPCRSGTTVMLRVFSAVGISSYYQPLKTILRWNAIGSNISWQVPQNSCVPIYIKETLGPNTKIETTFDPLSILLTAGFQPEKIQLLVIGREPLHTWASWLTCWKGDAAIDNFISSYITTERIKQMALKHSIQVTTMVYELFRDYSPERVIKNLFQRLGIEYHPIAVKGWDNLPQFGAVGSNVYMLDQHPIFFDPNMIKCAKTSSELTYISRNYEVNNLDKVDLRQIEDNNLFSIYHDWMSNTKTCLFL